MMADAVAYRHRLHMAWRNLQANRHVRPIDFINGFKLVHPLRGLGAPSESFDLAQLFIEMLTRLQIHYEPRPVHQAGVSPAVTPRRRFAAGPRIGLFVDAPDHLSGVCLTIQEWQAHAQAAGNELVVHTCAGSPGHEQRVVFPPMGSVRLDAYSGLTLHIPRMNEVLDYVRRMSFDAIHVSTPGPMGLLGLLAAHQRGLPVYGTYHTDFPRYAGELTGDPALERTGWRFMQWFYGQMQRVAAPTESIRQELMAHGFEGRHIDVVGRGVDTLRFNPSCRDATLHHRWGRGRSLLLMYAGRLSREKNLETLARAFKRLVPSRPDIGLVLAGDGPFRSSLENMLAGTPVHFTGVLHGDELARAYASCDLFVFPSKTDTFGRVVLEAQASGLPVIVAAEGGPKDAMRDGETGVVIHHMDAERLAQAIDHLTDDPARMTRMRRMARAYAMMRTPAASFDAFWSLHQSASQPDTTWNQQVTA